MKTFNEYQTELKRNIQHAPAANITNADLLGCYIPVQDGDLYICSHCSNRILGRGLTIPHAVPVYTGEIRGVCAVCSDDNVKRGHPYVYMGKLNKNTLSL